MQCWFRIDRFTGCHFDLLTVCVPGLVFHEHRISSGPLGGLAKYVKDYSFRVDIFRIDINSPEEYSRQKKAPIAGGVNRGRT